MKEHGILFKGEMVRAILDGSKTQTRRVMKPQPIIRNGRVQAWRARDDIPQFGEPIGEWECRAKRACPYGQVNSHLWVRETHAFMWPEGCDDGMIYDDDSVDGRPIRDEECVIEYRADTGNKRPGDWPDEPGAPQWRSSIHLPRWASRITLRIRDVRAERIQDISAQAAKREGVDPYIVYPWGANRIGYVEAFGNLWDSINAKRGYGWDTNHPVWALTFTKEP